MSNVVSPSSTGSIRRDQNNALIHQLFVRQEFDDCLTLIEETLKECKGQSEYPLYIKGSQTRWCQVLAVAYPELMLRVCVSVHLWCGVCKCMLTNSRAARPLDFSGCVSVRYQSSRRP